MNRRSLLRAATLAAASPMLNVRQLAAASGRAGAASQAWVEAARSEIPASARPYFQTAGIAPSPRVVIEEVVETIRLQNEGPVAPHIYAPISEIEPRLRERLAGAFGAAADQVALTHSTSEGINITSWAIDWKRGDEVIITNQEHPANLIPWYNLRDRLGIVIRWADFSVGTDLLDAVATQLGPRTRMASISHVSRNNGRTFPASTAAELAGMLHAQGALLHLDGAQGPGCVPVDFEQLGADYYSSCGHKWLLGPKGTGMLMVRGEQLSETRLTWTGSHSHTSMDGVGNYELIPEARRFEFGTRALATFAGFDRAVRWFEELGMPRVHERIDELVEYAIDAARERRGFGVSSPTTAGERSGVFVLRLPEGLTGMHVYEALQLDGIYGSPVDAERDFRVAIHFFNTRAEIDELMNAVETMAAA
jgi:selenocysteine lyase/cysteine desulfurase